MVRWRQVQRASCSLIAGLVFPLGLAPFDLKVASVLSLTLLYLTLVGQTAKRGALLGWLYGAGLFGAGVSWVFVSINVYGSAPTPLAVLLTLFSAADWLCFLPYKPLSFVVFSPVTH